jgi:exonuclease VII small subunit
MAEFVSAVLGLVVVGAEVGDSLYALIDTFKNAPREFLELSNEVTDFRAALSRLIEARESGELGLEESTRDSGLDGVVGRGKEIIQEVEELVKKVIKQQHGETEGTQVNRIRWLRRVKKAKNLQERLRAQKSSLCNFITIGMLYVVFATIIRSGILTTQPESPAQELESN